MPLNWDEIESKFNNFKDYAPAGTYKVKLASAENRTASTGTVWQEFKFEDSEQYAFPKVSHPISSNNQNWRAWHWRQLFVLFGATDEGAKKNVEACEGKNNFEQIAAAYLSAMNRLVAKHPEVEIEVWQDGKYMRADFNSSVRMNRPDDQKREAKTPADILEGATEVSSEETGDIPF